MILGMKAPDIRGAFKTGKLLTYDNMTQDRELPDMTLKF